MNHKHSFPTRCLALLLALVLVLSNANLGLTMRLQAADIDTSLFDVIAEYAGNDEMSDILNDYADALQNVENVDIQYAAEPTAKTAGATLRYNEELDKNVVTAPNVNGWAPYAYIVDGTVSYFSGNTAVVDKDVYEVKVVYQLDLKLEDTIEATMNEIVVLADEAQKQVDALESISSPKPLTALGMLDWAFIVDMIDSVDALNAKDFDDDVDLDAVKAEYKAIIGQLLDRLVEEGDPYYEIMGGRNGKTRIYADYLRVYAMLSEFNKNGLVHFYENRDEMLAEMRDLPEILLQILGEYDATTGTYANESVVYALLVEMNAEKDVKPQDLATMANRMIEAVDTLDTYFAYQEMINLKSEKLAGLCSALVDCDNLTYNSKVVLTSAPVVVLDDSWQYVKIALNGTDIVASYKLATDTEMTDEVVDAIIAYVESYIPHYTLKNVDAIKAQLKAYGKLNQTVELTADVEVKNYTLDVLDNNGDKLYNITVAGTDTQIELLVDVNYTAKYTVNGVEYIGTNKASSEKDNTIKVTLSADDMNLIAKNEFVIVLVDTVNFYAEDLNTLIGKMDDKVQTGSEEENAPSVTLETNEETGEQTIVATLSSVDDLMAVMEVLMYQSEFDNELTTVSLGGEVFIQENEQGERKCNMQAMFNAMMKDPTFSSEKLTDLGEGKVADNNLFTTTIAFTGYEEGIPFAYNLTDTADVAEIGAALAAVSDYFAFYAGQPAATFGLRTAVAEEPYLNVVLNLPEKAYEAYLTAALATWELGEADIASLNNKIAMEFVNDYFQMLMSADMDLNTVTNTLAGIGIDVDLSKYNNYYNMVKKVVNSAHFSYEITDDDSGRVDIAITELYKEDIVNLLNLVGMGAGLSNKIDAAISDDPLNMSIVVNLADEHPIFDALVVEPGKINDNGIKAKMNTIDYTTDLAKKQFTGHAAVMLLGDVDGNLNFPQSAVLDLNGHTVDGNITAAGKLVIIDSKLDTYNGGAVTGEITSNGGVILGGTFKDDVSAYLRDGYYQDNGSVRNALYYVEQENGVTTYTLNADFYRACDGYLPSVEALAAEIATDVALNGYYVYTAAGISYENNILYSLSIDNIFDSYLGGGKDGAVDALVEDMINTINAKGIETLANDIIDDLCDFKAISEALNNETTLCSYTFSFNPLGVEFQHNDSTNTVDISLVANKEITKTYTVALKIEGDNKYYQYAKDLLTAMAEIVTVDAGVELKQPTYDKEDNDLTVAGGAYADVVIDLSKDSDYTKAIAIILAYGNPDKAEALVSEMDCVMDLNAVIASMTVEEVFTALKNMSRDVTMAEMAEAVGYENAADMAKLEAVYHVVLCGMGKALECLDVTGNNNTLATYLVEGSESTYTYGKATADKTVDASIRSYTGIVKLTAAHMSVTIKLAPKCTKILGDANSDGKVNMYDALLVDAYSVDNSVEIHLCVSDVNGDEKYNMWDALEIDTYSVTEGYIFSCEKA